MWFAAVEEPVIVKLGELLWVGGWVGAKKRVVVVSPKYR